jgi:hypothetical protein
MKDVGFIADAARTGLCVAMIKKDYGGNEVTEQFKNCLARAFIQISGWFIGKN